MTPTRYPPARALPSPGQLRRAFFSNMPNLDPPEYVYIPVTEKTGLRVIVCGGRDYNDRERVFAALDAAHARKRIATLVHGGAPGADTLAGEWADARWIRVEVFPADWDRLKRKAQQLADAGADALIAFPGGHGTADMVRRAIAARIVVWKPFG